MGRIYYLDTKLKMEAASARVQEAVSETLTAVDREQLRNMQAQMHRCSAQCCENPDYKMDDVQRCIENCSGPITKAQAYIQNELQSFQERLQRCALDCQDKARDKVTASTSESELARLRSETESCVIKCADAHIDLIGSMKKRMLENLRAYKS